jgi:hypothetical protein
MSGVHRRWLQGRYADLPMVEMLALALERQLNGSLVVTEPDGSEHVVQLYRGVPVKCRTARRIAPLQSVLMLMGVVDDETLARSIADAARDHVMLGEQLTSQGAIDEATLLDALRTQVSMRVSYLFNLPAESRAFHSGADRLHGYGGSVLTPCNPFALIMHGARMLEDDALVQRRLAMLGRRPLILHRDLDVGDWELNRPERQVLRLLRDRPCSLQALRASMIAPDAVVDTLVYVLLLTHGLSSDEDAPISRPHLQPVIHLLPRQPQSLGASRSWLRASG